MFTKHLIKTLIIGLVGMAGFSGCTTGDDGDSNLQQTVLTAPTGVVAFATSSTRITISWTAVPGATLYYIYRSESGGPFDAIAAVHDPETTFDSVGLTAATTYGYEVAAFDPNDGSQSPLSSPAFATTGLEPPTGVIATPTSSSRITVSWTAAPAATLYYIYRSDAGGPFNAIAATSSTSFDAVGLTALTNYCYEIQSFNPSGISELSTPPACATTPDATGGLVAPTGVTAAAISSSRITVGWNAVPNATLYYIYRSDAGGPFNAIAATSSTDFDSADLTASTNYCYEIQSFNTAGTSLLSSPACATTFDTNGNLTPPANVSATTVSSSRIAVSWTPVSGANLYLVYQSDAGGPFNPVAAVAGTSYDAAGLAASTRFCYEVQASNAAGSSTLSQPPACATTGAGGLEARWKFDERTGALANDVSGFTFTGSLQGETSFNTTELAPLLDETAHNRSALSAPGGGGDFVNVPDDSAFTFGANDFTVSLWVNGPASGTVHLIGKRATGCGATNWELGTNGGAFFFSGATTSSFGSLAANTWTHVAVTSRNGSATFYVNGQPVGSGTFTAGAVLDDPLQIGNAGSCGNGSAVLIDEARLYSSALTASEVASLGTVPPAPLNLTGTVVSSTRVDLQWAPVANADMYIVFRGSAAGNETFLTTAPATPTTYIEGHLVPEQTTSWQIRAVVNGLISDLSNEVVLASNTAPPPPTGVTASAASQSQIDVGWAAEPTAAVYYIFMSTGGGPLVAIGAVTSPTTTFTAANLTTNTTYSFAVASMDSGQTIGAQSAPVAATTLP